MVGAILAVLYAANFDALHAVTGAEGAGVFRHYPAFFGLLFLLYLVGVWLSWSGGRRVALAVIGLGLLFRLLMLPTPVILSSDLYRYLWDGRVQTAGINPYRDAPQSEALAALRDPEVHPRINRPTEPTIYPPGAQLLFAGLAWIAPDRVWAWRLLLVLSELATLGLLLTLLRRLGLPLGRVAVYAWAPLPVLEYAQAGHMDATLVPFVLGALLARIAGRPALAGALLGGATLLKLYPAILLPVLWKPKAPRLLLAFLATVCLGYLPYAWGIGWRVTGFLPAYFDRHEDFNIGLRYFLTEGVGLTGHLARGAAMGLLAVVLGAMLVVLGRRRSDTPMGLARAAGTAVGAYLLLVPTSLHPWYVGWLVPFLAVLPGAGWWYLSGAVALSYLKYGTEAGVLPLWARCLEYLPVYALVLWDLRGAAGRAWPAPAALLRQKASP